MGIDVVTMEDCASNYGVFHVPGSKDNIYTVTFHGSEGPSHCTCKAFQYSGDKNCKHIERVWDQACLYNPQWKESKTDPALRPIDYTYDRFTDRKCECGGPTVSVRRAV